MTPRGRAVCILSVAALVALVPASPGLAKGKLMRGFDEDLLRSADPAIQATWFERTIESGAGIVRVPVTWRNVAASQPSSPTDPSDPAYEFDRLDASVAAATSRGFTVMMTVFRAPAWAEGAGAPPGAEPGTWKPDPAAFGAFAEALGRRYAGQVAYFEAWNEPNISEWLTPQWEGNDPAGAERYRLLLNAFYDGIKAANPAAKVVAGATAPYGDPGHPELGRTRPLEFLRQLLCLRPRGVAKCPTPAKFDVLSHHPINTGGGPERSARHDDDATTADFANVVDLLRRAERADTVLPRGRKRQAWASEIWWLSNPPGAFSSVPLQKHADWVQISLYELWKQGAATAIYYQLVDGPGPQGADPAAGLFFVDGREKPAYTAFRFPFVSEAVGRGRDNVWMIPPASGKLTIEIRGRGGWRAEKSLRVRAGRPEQTKLRLGNKEIRGVVAGETSLPWKRNR